VLENDGKVAHAEGDARDAEVRASLTQHVRDVERGRARALRHDAEQASGAWTALVLGRYGVVERTDGGRREYHVIAHPEHVWSGRELTSLEARVLELSARGMAGKVVAYSLGVSEAAVSGALGSAALKLGLASRNELVALAAQVLGPIATPAPTGPLTAAERDVLASLRRGWTNAAIATARGASQRTVANQIRSIMEKTGLGSRRALVALGPTHDEE
jgi:DNA-binding CsgD family transcriptional regulator